MNTTAIATQCWIPEIDNSAGVGMDETGAAYVAGKSAGMVRRIDPCQGEIQPTLTYSPTLTYTPTTPTATPIQTIHCCQMNTSSFIGKYLWDVEVDRNRQKVYVACPGDNTMSVYNYNCQPVATVTGLNKVYGLAMGSDNYLYAALQYNLVNGRVVKINPDDWSRPASITMSLVLPNDVMVDDQGYIYVLSSAGKVLVYNFSPTPTRVATISGVTSSSIGLLWDNGKLYCSKGSNKVVQYIKTPSVSGTPLDFSGPTTVATINSPRGKAMDAVGYKYVFGNTSYTVFKPDWTPIATCDYRGDDAEGFAIDEFGANYSANTSKQNLDKYDSCGFQDPTLTFTNTPTITNTFTPTPTAGQITYTYDNNGNMLSETKSNGLAVTYTYDSENHLHTMSDASGAVTFTYDYSGNLVEKKSASVTIHYLYGFGPAPLAEIDTGTRLETDFIQANGRTWGTMKTAGNTYFHHDAIGSVVALSGASGEVTDTYEYAPFGKLLYHQGNTTDNDYLFVGGYGVRRLTDKLDTMGVRQYNTQLGRFTTEDPLGFGAGDVNFYRYVESVGEVFENAYEYALNNPLTFTDRWGLAVDPGPQPLPIPPELHGPPPNPGSFPNSFLWYGFWGGANWTGGQWGNYNQINKACAKNPYDARDGCYMVHDMGYGKCRNTFSSGPMRAACFRNMDRLLARCLNNLGVGIDRFWFGVSNPKGDD